MVIVQFWEEAVKDYKKLDGNTRQWVDVAVVRLKESGRDIGKSLSNTNDEYLSGYKELKQHKLGVRMIFKQLNNRDIEVIKIEAVVRREYEELFKVTKKHR